MNEPSSDLELKKKVKSSLMRIERAAKRGILSSVFQDREETDKESDRSLLESLREAAASNIPELLNHVVLYAEYAEAKSELWRRWRRGEDANQLRLEDLAALERIFGDNLNSLEQVIRRDPLFNANPRLFELRDR